MASAKTELTARIREMRRRHFGARGKAEFARRLGIPPTEYDAYERSTVPPGEMMLRMCEVTGEDLQWLLVGQASRGTVVIDAPQRHRGLIARIAKELEANPRSAAPLEAFVDLLTAEDRARRDAKPLSAPRADALLPLFRGNQAPTALDGAAPSADRPALPLPGPEAETRSAALCEPASEYAFAALREVRVVETRGSDGAVQPYLESPEIAGCFPQAFGVMIEDDSMRPMFEPGDAAVVSAEAPPVVGRPAVCRTTSEPAVRCGIWLGQAEGLIRLGRIGDSELDTIDPATQCWALEALYRVALRN